MDKPASWKYAKKLVIRSTIPCKPKSFGDSSRANAIARQIQLTNDGQPIVVLREREMGFMLGNRAFQISRSGTIPSVFKLTSGENAPVATLEQVPFRNRYTLSFGGEEWVFQSASLTDTKFSLEQGGDRMGSISAEGRSSTTTYARLGSFDAAAAEPQAA